MVEGETNAYKLSSDFHTGTWHAYVPPRPHPENNRKENYTSFKS
jgi:hypothetical protein